jgi:hypothetical protein
VSEAAKLDQDINEFFEVNTLPNGFGAGIERLIGLVSLSEDMFVTMTERQIREGLQQFIYLQQSNLAIPRSAKEKIVKVTSILIQRNPLDPTMFYFRVNFVTQDGQQQSATSSIGT